MRAFKEPGPGPEVVAVLGAGSWGTTFAKIIADASEATGAEREVRIWGRRAEVVEQINSTQRNDRYLKDVVLPLSITASTDVAEVLGHAELVFLAVPAQSLRPLLREWKHLFNPDTVVVSLMKGLEQSTDARMSQVISQELGIPDSHIAVVSGPNLAMEIAREEPTASVVACKDIDTATAIAQRCTAPYFRPYTSSDLVGVEIGGIVKNVIALAVGICEGRQMGDNTKASVITRGLAETSRLALALGGKPHTLAGLAGLGDLVATCSSSLSRNHTAGRLLGQGLSLDQLTEHMTQTAEGIKSGPAVNELAGIMNVDMPITAAVVEVLEGKLLVENLGPRLMARALKSEGAC
ncbi:NAD(P)H-dependent glycerol-3-phosphate dehydrogenase [Paenarthrobacter ureafaciens]|uniref:NAD(P)H-dependent glycerol-3-phosphate dehydrogenase n=1 Tax=Paenarthrobacter ureafaciens TaxID=37931 RepID=UPI001409F44D|nr:NAD(P)H-dependent glycerol-3-phosphate dehydrogenase [Paenarthrobacter ureafaciens]MCX8453059.1 NAD(P)-dependent glycerol-3-phosphate dehydrogenase [Paenarthrobacter ureafaciens]MCY0972639.1 NAD(P)-dependent glycerol-3-phosphate dehydrogenase [Paenarthrobacter ureafaciens]QQQ64245.1 NAD(P)-dependent glycerol-3-phosphate dehydrogenase [Paenarthrobacter ureafaciens]